MIKKRTLVTTARYAYGYCNYVDLQ